MRLFNRLKDLFRSERGNVLAIGAATLPLLMGSAGFAIDSVQMAMWERQLQRAADSAALAGAHAMVQNSSAGTAVANDLDEHISFDLEQNQTPVLKAGSPAVDPGGFADGAFVPEGCEAVGAACWQAVQVSLTTERRLPFMGLFTEGSTELSAVATAAIVASGEYCMVSLYEGADSGIIAGGNATLTLGCGMATNARGASAIRAFGSATISADPAGSVGGISGASKFTEGTTLLPYSAPIKDPFADVPDPVLPETCGETLSVPNGSTVTLDPDTANCWGDWNIQGTVNLEPGTYFVNNGTLDTKGSVSGENVTLVLMGDDSGWTQNGGGQLELSAPTEGPYKGIVIFRERDASSDGQAKTIKLNGGADLRLTGSIYGKNTDFWIGGNADIDARCIQVVGRKLEFKGGGAIENECEGTGASAFSTQIVRLVA